MKEAPVMGDQPEYLAYCDSRVASSHEGIVMMPVRSLGTATTPRRKASYRTGQSTIESTVTYNPKEVCMHN